MDYTIIVEGFQLFLSYFWIVPIGVFFGMLIGAMPGLSSSNSLAIMLPVLLAMPPDMGLIFIVCVYAGGEVGNSYPAIVLNIPGNASSAITALEGYPLTQRGKASYALGFAIMGSTLGGILSGISILFLTPFVAKVALYVSPIEMTIIIMFGLVIIAQLGSGGLTKGIMAGFLGLLIATVGTDPQFGQRRLTFDTPYLMDGLPVIPVLVGVLAFSEVLRIANKEVDGASISTRNVSTGFKEVLSGMKDTLKRPIEVLRSSIIGIIIGIIPGAGTSVASFLAYQQSYNFAKPEKKKLYGKGSTDGLLAVDTANNAMIGGGLVPLLTLGIPGSTTLAIALVIMGYHGLAVGPMLLQRDGAIAYAMIWSVLGSALVLLFLGTIVAFFVFQALKIPMDTLLIMIALLTLIGGFASRQYVFDMWLVIFFGIIGYFMKKYEYPTIGLIIGFVLGYDFESNVFRGIDMGLGSPYLFFTKPYAILLWVLLILTALAPFIIQRRNKGSAELVLKD